jgi:uncharacterized membrane protein YfcA
MSNDFETKVIAFILSLLIYTYAKKKKFQHLERNISERTQILNCWYQFIVGFMTVYWTRHWKFLVVAFIALMGFDFLHASANAKMVTNFV